MDIAMIRIVAGVIAIVILAILVQRRRSRVQ